MEAECYPIQRNNLEKIRETLFKVLDKNPDCVIDLTGGDELSLVVVGTVAESIKEKNISFHRVNINTRKLLDFFGTDFTSKRTRDRLYYALV